MESIKGPACVAVINLSFRRYLANAVRGYNRKCTKAGEAALFVVLKQPPAVCLHSDHSVLCQSHLKRGAIFDDQGVLGSDGNSGWSSYRIITVMALSLGTVY